jgi:hypothetical protein
VETEDAGEAEFYKADLQELHEDPFFLFLATLSIANTERKMFKVFEKTIYLTAYFS